MDCEANVHTDAGACVRVGDNAQSNVLVNLYTESQAEIANLQLDPGSQDTKIVNLFAVSAGPAIYDLSGGNYDAVGAGGRTGTRCGALGCARPSSRGSSMRSNSSSRAATS